MKRIVLILLASMWLLFGEASAFGATARVSEERITKFLRAQPVVPTDTETPEQRKVRIGIAASAIHNATRNKHEAVVLLTLIEHESKLALYVARGCVLIPATASGNCDNGLARSYWQMHEASCGEGWSYQRGDPHSVAAFARCAIRIFNWAQKECLKKPNHGELEAGFAGYKTTTRCDWPGSKGRAETYRRIWGEL